MALNEQDLQALKRALSARARALRGEVSDKLGQAAEDAHGGLGSSDVSEQSVAASESEIDMAEAGRDLKELAAIDAALRAIDEGVYGTCARCGVTISEARLKAQPLATRCVECQTRDEQRRT